MSGTQGTPSPTLWFSHQRIEGAHFVHFVFIPQGTVNTPDTLDTLMKRLFCHIVLDRLPPPGVEESYDTLRDMFAYYAHRPQANALPAVTQKMPARTGKAYERPPFHFEEE